MLRFRSHFRAALLCLATLLTAHCTQPDKHSMNSGATFVVTDGFGSAMPVAIEEKAVWKIPSAVSVTFNVCLKDRVTNTDLRGQQFAIGIPETGRRIEDVRSTPKGCLSWSEDIAFNYLAKQSTYVKIVREVVGTGVYPGVQIVEFAVNPWAVGANRRDEGVAVVYLAKESKYSASVQNALEGAQATKALAGEGQGQAEIIVREVSLKTIREGNKEDGFLVRITLKVAPQVKVKNQLQEESFVKLNGAEFDVIGHLVANNVGASGNGRMILTSGDAAVGVGVVENGQLISEIKSFVDRRVSSGNLELALKLVPRGIGGAEQSKAFEGIFRLGDISRLNGDSSGHVIEDCRSGGCSIAKYLQKATNYNELVASGEARKNQPYLYQNLTLRFVKVLNGETATQRNVAYTASTCIVDAFNGSRPIQTPFKVQYVDEKGNPEGPEINGETDETGCLRWNGELSHKFYRPEQFFAKRVLISRGPAKRYISFYINPWDDKFTFGFDQREFRAGYFAELSKRKLVPSRFYLADFAYHTVRFKYDIDPFMQLEVKKTVLMELQPRVLRYSGITNARKMTESIRDGIYLMKVAIQKDYLDPADPGRMIRNKPPSVKVELGNKLKVPANGYVSTKTTLVRVTDGMIIQPVELTMRDLRLMRVRANFMVQLQTVDERLVQGDNVLREKYRSMLKSLDEVRVRKMADIDRVLETNDETERAAVLSNLEAEAKVKRLELKTTFVNLKGQLEKYNQLITPFDARSDSESVLNSNETFKDLNEAIEFNDFTAAKLSSSNEMDLNLFVEPNSGLEKRTFVGPVIFLSNTYKDSVRATDNLDEAKCDVDLGDVDRIVEAEGRDSTGKSFYADEERKHFLDSESTLKDVRENKFYTYSKYFGSLRHLCYASVDDMIKIEARNRSGYKEQMGISASLYNYGSTYGLDYLSLKDIPLTKFDDSCNGPLSSCVKPTRELTISRAEAQAIDPSVDLNGLMESKLDEAQRALVCKAIFDRAESRIAKFYGKNAGKSFYNKQNDPHGQLLMNRSTWEGWCRYSYFGDYLLVDRKLRVLDTGNDYIFKGGLQLNFNVGESVSVGRANSWSGSAGFEVGDVVGFFSPLAGWLAKPFSLKFSKSTSLSESEGTSIAQQTYLVSQIAKFNVNITRYEKCNVFRLNGEILDYISQYRIPMGRGGSIQISPKLINEISRGLLVCDGEVHEQPINVDEIYFYFTQHFTEGDMLDQADPYNNPWLLALRGLRDFSVFVSTIKAQDEVSFGNMVNGYVGPRKTSLGWPLEKMRETYRQITPSYPGFYTILDQEKFTQFPLENRLSAQDGDCNGEVGAPAASCKAVNVTKPKETQFF